MTSRVIELRQNKAEVADLECASRRKPHAFELVDVSGMTGALRRYYEEQNEMITLWDRDTHGLLSGENKEDHVGIMEHRVVNASFFCNVFLLIIKIWALSVSGSLAMLASVLDSCLDLLSGSMLFLARRATRNRDKYKYPVGKQRVQPIATIIFACLMGMSALQVIIESARTLYFGFEDRPPNITVNFLVIMIAVVTIGLKAVLHVVCRVVAAMNPHGNSVVSAYAQDHFNDTITNSVGIGGMLVAGRMPSFWYFDALAAVIIAAYIVYNWASTGNELVKLLMGRSASPQFLQYVTYLAMKHSDSIKAVDTVRAYHMGERLFVEVHIVLDPETQLFIAHDVGESLEAKIEQIEEVERCFVHLDFNFDHSPEHKVY